MNPYGQRFFGNKTVGVLGMIWQSLIGVSRRVYMNPLELIRDTLDLILKQISKEHKIFIMCVN